MARIRLSARLAGADLDLDVAPTAKVGRITVRVLPGVRARLHIGANTTVEDGVEIRLRGGSVRIGEWCEIRSGVRMMVVGDLRLEGENALSWGVVVHCDESITLAPQATCAEYVTLTDSVHEHLEGAWHADQLRTAPVRLGRDTWVGSKATVARGVTIGDRCVVAGSAVVTRDVPDDHLAKGVPATVHPLPRG